MAKTYHAVILFVKSFALHILQFVKLRKFILPIFLLLISLWLKAETIKTNNPGNWESGNIWDGNSVPLSTDNAVIDNAVTISAGTTVEIFDLTINSTLTINGTLIVYGNLETGNNSELIANSGSSIFIFGHAVLANRVSLDLSSYFVVKGDFTKGGASNHGNLTISGAHIYIFGEVDVPLDKNGIPWENFSVCSTGDYDGTTESTNDVCDAGQFDDFVDNIIPDDLPDGIYDQLIDCDTPTATIADDATICEGELVAYLYFSSTTADTYSLDFDATAESQGFVDVSGATLSGNEIEVTVPGNSDPGTYNANLTITNSTTGCTSTIYNITVTIHPLPATGEIISD